MFIPAPISLPPALQEIADRDFTEISLSKLTWSESQNNVHREEWCVRVCLLSRVCEYCGCIEAHPPAKRAPGCNQRHTWSAKHGPILLFFSYDPDLEKALHAAEAQARSFLENSTAEWKIMTWMPPLEYQRYKEKTPAP